MDTNQTKVSLGSSMRGAKSTRRAYRLREIEAETGIPVSTLRAMIRRGSLNPITGFGTWLIPAEEYERVLATRLRNQ